MYDESYMYLINGQLTGNWAKLLANCPQFVRLTSHLVNVKQGETDLDLLPQAQTKIKI